MQNLPQRSVEVQCYFTSASETTIRTIRDGEPLKPRTLSSVLRALIAAHLNAGEN